MPPVLPDALVGWANGSGTRSTSPASPRSQNPRSRGSRSQSALEALLVDLGPQIQHGPRLESRKGLKGLQQDGLLDRADGARRASEPSEVCATGLAALDAHLGGGFPRGRLSEICGPPSSGRTALALALLDTTLRQGGLTGWIDLADAFDPRSASASGLALERLLWVRPRSEKEALQSCDRLLRTQGFELIVFDCVKATREARGGGRADPPPPPISDVSWLRLARLAAKTSTALVVLSQAYASLPSQAPAFLPSQAYASLTGSRAALLLEMLPLGARFVGSPSLLESLETTAVLRRHRTRPSGCEVALSALIEPER